MKIKMIIMMMILHTDADTHTSFYTHHHLLHTDAFTRDYDYMILMMMIMMMMIMVMMLTTTSTMTVLMSMRMVMMMMMMKKKKMLMITSTMTVLMSMMMVMMMMMNIMNEGASRAQASPAIPCTSEPKSRAQARRLPPAFH